MSPTSRTLRQLRREGAIAGVVERYNHHCHTRHDLFGFIDIVAIAGTTIGIQACCTGDIRKRERKIKGECKDFARRWLEAGNRIQIWGWKKYKRHVDRRLWRETVVEITLNDLHR